MIPNDQPLREQTINRMINTLMDKLSLNEGMFTKWESNFIESIYEQFERKKDLSDKQCEILERIYDK
jgi:hypothetical protein